MDPAQAIEVAASSRTEAVNLAISRGDSDIQRFYKNSVVFLTGGSGFLGKQLTEKLLRSCSISKLYFLIRPKKGKSTQQRLNELFKESVFDSLRKMQPNFASKIVPVAGDVADIKLGIPDDVWKTLTEEVNVIFHVAATTKFDETIQIATLINVRGTREILSLGKSCKNLKSFVHVSTAYTHATTPNIDKEVPELFFPTPISPDILIQMAENVEDSRLVSMTPGLIKDWPNTYTFTKAVAEQLIRETSDGLPICIVRPGIIICSYSEPSPGWIDYSCIYGATGILYGVALGVLHTFYVNYKTALGFIPCDIVNNAIIATGREAATSQARGGSDTRIYNVTTTNRNPFTWKTFIRFLRVDGPNVSTPSSIYYCYSHDTSSKLVYMLLFLFLHIIPAYVVDGVRLLLGKPARFAKLSRKFYDMTSLFSFFLINQWTFVDTNLEKLFNSLSPDDQTIFNIDIVSIDLKNYLLLWCISLRKYILKDGLQGTRYAVKKQIIFRCVNYVFIPIYLYLLYNILYYVLFSLSVCCTYTARILEYIVN